MAERTLLIEPHRCPSGRNLMNDDRAAMTRPFVEAYRRAHYGSSDEPLGMVLVDMMANMLHLADQLDDYCFQNGRLGGRDAALRAIDHYDCEVLDEREETTE